MAAVRQRGQGVGGGEFTQFEIGALAVRDVGDEAVPDNGAVGPRARAGVALAPAQALLRQADTELQVPGRLRGGRGLQRRVVDRQVLGMDALLDRRRAGCGRRRESSSNMSQMPALTYRKRDPPSGRWRTGTPCRARRR